MCFEHMASEAGEANCLKHAYCKESTACSLLSVMLFIHCTAVPKRLFLWGREEE